MTNGCVHVVLRYPDTANEFWRSLISSRLRMLLWQLQRKRVPRRVPDLHWFANFAMLHHQRHATIITNKWEIWNSWKLKTLKALRLIQDSIFFVRPQQVSEYRTVTSDYIVRLMTMTMTMTKAKAWALLDCFHFISTILTTLVLCPCLCSYS